MNLDDRELWLHELDETYTQAVNSISGLESQFSKEDLKRALLAVDAYSIPLEIRGTKRLSMIPYMCNLEFILYFQ